MPLDDETERQVAEWIAANVRLAAEPASDEVGTVERTDRITQSDFEAVCARDVVTVLRMQNARRLTSLSPIAGLPSLRELTINAPFLIEDLSPLGRLTSLRALWYGNGDLGNDRVVKVQDLRWTRTLVKLEKLEFGGMRLIDADLSPLLELPNLRVVSFPLARAYRRTVFEYAKTHPAFAELAAAYDAYDAFRVDRGLIKPPKLPDLD